MDKTEHKTDFYMIRAAHQAKGDAGMKSRLLKDKAAQKYTLLLVNDEETDTLFYISAKEFINNSPLPKYEIGVIELLNGSFALKKIYSQPDMPRDMRDISIRLSGEQTKEQYEMLTVLYNGKKYYSSWAESMNCEPFWRCRWNEDRTRVIRSVEL